LPSPLSVTVLPPVVGELTIIVNAAFAARPFTAGVKVIGIVVWVPGIRLKKGLPATLKGAAAVGVTGDHEPVTSPRPAFLSVKVAVVGCPMVSPTMVIAAGTESLPSRPRPLSVTSSTPCFASLLVIVSVAVSRLVAGR
jgi:hypothetical protein